MSWISRTFSKAQSPEKPRLPKLIEQVAHDYEFRVQQFGTYQRRIEFPSDGSSLQLHYISDQTDDNYEAIAKLGQVPSSNVDETYAALLTQIAPETRGLSIHVSPQQDIMATISRDFLGGLPDGDVKLAVMDDISRVDDLHKRVNRTFFGRTR